MISEMFPELAYIKDPTARAKLEAALASAMKGDSTGLKDISKYTEIPVGFKEFITSPDYLNYVDEDGVPILYPEVLDEMCVLNEGDYIEAVFTGGIGCGKALEVKTPILVKDKGYIPIGDVCTGDRVAGTDGWTIVTKAHPSYDANVCINVTFSNGEVIKCDPDHLWTVIIDGKTETLEAKNLKAVKEVMALPRTNPYNLAHRQAHRCVIKETTAFQAGLSIGLRLEFLYEPLPFISHNVLHELSRDPLIVWHIGEDGLPVYQSSKKHSQRATLSCLLKNRDFIKVPLSIRLQLLKGIFSSASVIEGGVVTLSATNKDLIEVSKSLCTHCGFYFEESIGTFRKTNGKYPYTKLLIYGVPKEVLLDAPESYEPEFKDLTISKVHSRKRPIRVRCLTVSAEDKLYLVGRKLVPTHNTTAALATIAYQLYKVSCLVNPQAYFGLDPSSEIVFIFQSVTEKIAKTVNYARFKALMDKSPYFKSKFPYNRDIESELQFPHRIYVKPVSATDTSTIGQNVFCGIIDEINFFDVIDNSKRSNAGGVYDHAIEVYNSMASRRKSRFLVNGVVQGILCLVSSKNYPNDFTERKEQEAKTDKTIFVYSKRIWDIKPSDYTQGWFSLFTGDLTRPPRIVEDDFPIPEKDAHLYDKIPMEFKKDFERDMMRHIRETAGIATMALHPFIMDSEKIFEATQYGRSIGSRTIVDFVDTQLELDTIDMVNPTAKRWIHLDLALTGDSAGFVMGHIAKFVKVDRGDTFEVLPVFVIDMTLEVAPPLGSEIQFWKIRELIYALRDTLGIPVEWVSLDTYQSADTMQILRTKGFKAGIQSIDRTTAPYEAVKQALYDGRLVMPYHERLCTELVQLEIDMKKGKVDHPARGSCLPDTKIEDTSGVTRTILEMVEGHARGERYTVLGYNLETKSFEPQQVTDPRMTRHTDTTYRIHGEEGVIVELTGEHKVLITRGWVETCDLVEGDSIISIGDSKTITGIELIKHAKEIPVYDLGAYPDENFCLANGSVIHNSKDVADGLAGVIYGLLTRGDLWLEAGITPHSIPDSVRSLTTSNMDKV